MNNKQFYGLHNRLMGLLDEQSELFMRERPFLDGGDLEISHLEEVKQNKLEIELTVKSLQSVIKKSLPPPLPPTQGELL